jgi:hypothetical protein
MKKKKVFKFNELMDPETSINLGLPDFLVDKDDEDYFFDYKEVNKLWDEGLIKVYVHNVRFDGDSLIFKTTITISEVEFEIYVLVDFSENVEFGSEQGSHYIESFEMVIEDELEYFQDMFEDIYNELIPEDFWKVKSRVN